MLLRMAALLACEWPGVEDNTYYWTHNAYADTDDYPNLNTMRTRFIIDIDLVYTSQIRVWGSQAVVPSTGAVVWQQANSTGNPGAQAAVEVYNLLLAARWRFWGADGSTGYHLHRYPQDPAWIEGDRWSEEGLGQNTIMLNSWLFDQHYRTSTGALITRAECSPDIVSWQLRHGTRRRNRRFWLP